MLNIENNENEELDRGRIHNNKAVQADNKSVQADNKSVQADNKSVQADNKSVQADNKSVQADNKSVLVRKIPVTWLRMYPGLKLAEESTCTYIMRCLLCQIGLACFLVLWTILWIFVIQSYEGPYETYLTKHFEMEQNQLVIDLAAELRHLTPLSPRWQEVIEERIAQERVLTMMAVARGARVHPGQFWSLSGTALFSVYVMTALGFGAPVPQTMWGRSFALVYAFLAVPVHIYFMVNLSTCVVVHVEMYNYTLKNKLHLNKSPVLNKTTVIIRKGSQNIRRNSEISSSMRSCIRSKIMHCGNLLFVCRCVPLAAISYYVLGAVTFGVIRRRQVLEILMFPIEFTTSGGLDHVVGYVRLLYGVYVEGAMVLLACALATMRHHSISTISRLSKEYKLFTEMHFYD